MKKKGHRPVTKVKNPEPKIEDPDWVIWAAWADRITFEEIEKKTGYKESEVIKMMRRSLKPSSFRLWRKRVHNKSIKHRKKFKLSRKKMVEKIQIDDVVSAIPVHLAAGIWGTIAVVFTNGEAELYIQILSIILIGLFVTISTGVIWLILKSTLGIRVSPEAETIGLDLSELGIEAYPEFSKS